MELRFTFLEKRRDDRFESLTALMIAESDKRDAQYASILAHLRELRAEVKNATTQQVYELAQRVTAIETPSSDASRQLS